MGLSRFPDASEGGVIVFLMIHAALFIAVVKDFLVYLLQEMGLKANTGTPELAETQLSYVEESSGLSQLAMTAEEFEDRLPVTLFEASISSGSDNGGDGVSECVVCLRKFHGGEEIRGLPCEHIFHKGCVDKWLLDYKNMACPSCRLCLVNVPAEQDGFSRE